MKAERNHGLKINAACVLENTMWFVLEETNAFCKLDLTNGEIGFISHIPDESLNRARLYDGIVSYQNKLILIPESAKEIAIYDINCNSFRKIELNSMIHDRLYNPYVKFFSGVVVGQNLYLIPRKYPAIVEVNLETGQVNYYTDWVKKFEMNISEPDRALFKEDVALIDQKLYFCSPSNSYSLEFDIITKESRLVYIGNPSCNVFDLNGHSTYLSVDCGFFKSEEDEFESSFPDDFCCGSVNFNKSFDVGKVIYFAPCKSNQILSFDKDTKKWITLYYFEDGRLPWKHLCMSNKKVYFYDQYEGILHVLEDGKWADSISLINVNQIVTEVYENQLFIEPVHENEYFDLSNMIEMVR